MVTCYNEQLNCTYLELHMYVLKACLHRFISKSPRFTIFIPKLDCNLPAQTLTSFKFWLQTAYSIILLSQYFLSFHFSVHHCPRATMKFIAYCLVEISQDAMTYLFLIGKLKSGKENILSQEI